MSDMATRDALNLQGWVVIVQISRIAAVAFLSICAMLAGAAPSQAATPALSINDITVNEPNWPDWEAPAVFTVSLDQAAPEPVTVHWATSKPLDYWDPEFKQESGTVTIPEGALQGTLTVTVLRETANTRDRQFNVLPSLRTIKVHTSLTTLYPICGCCSQICIRTDATYRILLHNMVRGSSKTF